MLSKTKWITGISTIFGVQIILIPILWNKDSKVTAVTFASSSSLFDLFESLGDNRKNSASTVKLEKIDFSILPTGSSWGREILNNKQVDLALVSTEREKTIYGGPKENILEKAINVIANAKEYFKEEKIKEWGLADDSIIFLFHESIGECDKQLRGGAINNGWQAKYRGGVTSLLSNGEEPQISSGWFFWSSNNEKFPCFNKWQAFSREGNEKRSSLNKVLFKKENKKFNNLVFKEIPENNYFALEFLSRESFENSILAVPESFYKKNKKYLENLGLKSTGLTAVAKRRLKFEIEKSEIENNYYKRLWINTVLINSNEMLKNFELEAKHFYWDKNLLCLKYEGDEAREVHTVTGRLDGINQDAVEDCKKRNQKEKEKL